MSALLCYEPINELKEIDRNLWIADGPVVYMSYLWPKIPFTTRMTVVRLENNDLFVHSPVAYNLRLANQLDQLGRVAYLVSPNKIHYEGMISWRKHYPDAVFWASPGVRERAKEQGFEIQFDRDLGDIAPPEWRSEIEQTIVRGSRALSEVVFFHKESRTLLLADLIENFEPERVVSPFWRTLIRISGSVHPDGKMPIDLRYTFRGREHIAAEGINKLISWNPDRVILSHGKWYESNGTAELKRAFRWLGDYIIER